MDRYTGRTVAITGAASGLGAAMADKFAAEGATLFLMDIDGDRVLARTAELVARGIDAAAIASDVADKASVLAAVQRCEDRFGRCDVLCANVGVQQFGAIDTLTDEDWRWVLSTNFLGVVNTVGAFLPLLRRGTGARHIVLTSSASVFQIGVRMAAYIASKFAVTGYGEVLRRELAGEGINVALLFPAGMSTRHLESSMAARPGDLGPSRFDPGDIEAMMADAAIDPVRDMIPPDAAIRNLLDELDARSPYIVTHGSYRGQVEAQQHEVLAAFDRMAGGN